MIIVDEHDPVGDLELSFEPRNVNVKKNVDAKKFYDLLSEIGRGKFGTVYKCQEKSTGLKLAAKFIPIPKRDDRRNVEREVEIMNSLQHSLIIQLYDAYEYGKMMCVVLELIEGGELFDRVIDDEFLLTEKACTVLVRQLCQAMAFVHSNNIIHLDLKPENILCLTRDGNRIKIIDFGLARRYDPNKKLQVLFGTPEFVAPEVVNFDRISFGTDMWSVGVICYVLLSGLSPFMGSTDVETMTNVTIGKYDFDDEAFSKMSKEALDFIAKLLEKDITIRMTADQCLEHDWLKKTTEKSESSANLAVIDNTSTIENSKSPSIEVHDSVNENELQLTSTKENLKLFIERWEEHPNSPYVFDANTTLILPAHDNEKNTSSGFSSRGCSPSPCESLSSNKELFQNGSNSGEGGGDTSNSETLAETESNNLDAECESIIESNNKHQTTTKDIFERPNSSCSLNRQNKEYLQSFDRRHSDSNYVINHTTSLEKINLAEEIKKLSDRLMMLSSINDELVEYNKRLNDPSPAAAKPASATSQTVTVPTNPTIASIPPKPITDTKSTAKQSSEALKNFKNSISNSSVSSSTTTVKKSSKEKVLIHSKSLLNQDEASSSPLSTASVVNDLTERLKSLDEIPSIFKNVVNAKSDATTATFRSIEKATNSFVDRIQFGTSLSSSSSASTSPCNINGNGNGNGRGSVPWTITNRRTKFRVTQLSRDVPIGSPDSHQTVFLEEAANTTKDCLLHLLDKYNSNESRSISTIRRHQSISVGHGITDNLEYHSMNSINAFFKRNAFQQSGTTVRKIKARIESTGKP